MHLYSLRRDVAAQVAEELKTVTYATPNMEDRRKRKRLKKKKKKSLALAVCSNHQTHHHWTRAAFLCCSNHVVLLCYVVWRPTMIHYLDRKHCHAVVFLSS